MNDLAASPNPRGRRLLLAEHLRDRHGLIARAELLALGFSSSAIGRLVADELLIATHRGVYRSGGAPLTAELRLRSQLQAAGPGAVLGRASAAHRRGHLRFPPEFTQIAVPRTWGKRQRGDFVVFHAPTLTRDEISPIEGVLGTSDRRTLLDLAAVTRTDADLRVLRRVARQSTVDDHTIPVWLEALLSERAPFPGSRRLATILDENLPDTAVLHSTLEEDFLDFCRAEGLPLPRTNAVVIGYEVDALWELEKVIAELDTYDFHGDPGAFERDRARDAELTVAGFRTIRITGRRLRRERSDVLAQCRALLGI